jgi:hypothetical protein
MELFAIYFSDGVKIYLTGLDPSEILRVNIKTQKLLTKKMAYVKMGLNLKKLTKAI